MGSSDKVEESYRVLRPQTQDQLGYSAPASWLGVRSDE